MSSIIYSVLSVYIFILIGLMAKMSFKEKIDDKTITLLNVYFLQVFLTFWGLLSRTVDITLLYTPSLYLLIVCIVLLISAFLAKFMFENKKEYSIATVAIIIGNTGNLGIPINIAIFGEESIPYTTIINLMNVFVVYTIGVFYYSRGSFDTKTSIKNIFKLPIIWAAILALLLSYFGYEPSVHVMKILTMGAYTSIAMQLILFGIYLYGTKVQDINKKLTIWVVFFKFILLPLIAFLIIRATNIDPMLKGILFIELATPLAVANVNLASLYDCKPKLTTSLVFITSVLFLGVIFLAIYLLKYI